MLFEDIKMTVKTPVAGQTSFVPPGEELTKPSLDDCTEVDRAQRRDQHWLVLDMMLSSIVDQAYTFDREGRFLYANRPLLEIWGLSLEEALGKNFYDLQ